jgi:mRNA-degrading endonuclease RelE of RelBE toxin-antitoxin system
MQRNNELEEILQGIILHPDVEKEILEELAKRGKPFFRLFIKRITQLKDLGVSCVSELSHSFESLKRHRGLYSLHIRGKGFNYRIIYSYISQNEIFLHGFYEKDSSKSGYDHHIPIAKKRLSEWREKNE